MAQSIVDNKLLFEVSEIEQCEFRYNFISIPWNVRTSNSKIGVIFLLVSIFVSTMICVFNNFYIHYKSYRAKSSDVSTYCHLVKMEENRFVAGIYTLSSKELLCVGAVVGDNTVLAAGICIKSGPIRIRFGGHKNSRCRRGFTVDVVDTIYHEGVVSQKLVLLSSYEGMENCGATIKLGKNINVKSKAYIFGRPLHSSIVYSRQSVTVIGKGNCTFPVKLRDKLKQDSTLCVKGLVRCPIRAGDLLIQNDRLFGIASTTVHKREEDNIGYFADLEKKHVELKDFEIDVPDTKE